MTASLRRAVGDGLDKLKSGAATPVEERPFPLLGLRISEGVMALHQREIIRAKP